MRIRKNARVSVLTHAYDAGLLTEMPSPHVCELNQSPWDVVVFSADSTAAESLSGHFQAGEEHESFYTPDASSWFDDSSVGAADESSAVASVKMSVEASGSDDSSEMMRDHQWGSGIIAGEEEKVPAKSMSDWVEVKAKEKEGEGERLLVCNRADGRGWHCWREAVPNHSLCKHHLAQVKVRAPAAIRLPSSRTNKSKSPHSNRNQFSYYSGLGPRRGKRIGGGGGGCGMESIGVVHNNVTTVTGKQEEEGAGAGDEDEEMEFVDEDYDDYDEDDNEGGRKRPRKPVKARSLKSLM